MCVCVCVCVCVCACVCVCVCVAEKEMKLPHKPTYTQTSPSHGEVGIETRAPPIQRVYYCARWCQPLHACGMPASSLTTVCSSRSPAKGHKTQYQHAQSLLSLLVDNGGWMVTETFIRSFHLLPFFDRSIKKRYESS